MVSLVAVALHDDLDDVARACGSRSRSATSSASSTLLPPTSVIRSPARTPAFVGRAAADDGGDRRPEPVAVSAVETPR